jgi:hypothetical protein
MVKSALSAGIACSLAAITASAWAALPGQSAAVALSSNLAGARPVALTLALRYEMQCGSPGVGPVTLTLPAKMAVPANIAASAVLVDGKAAPSLTRSGSKILVGLPPQPRIMCDSITLGTLTIVLTKAAGIGNPKSAGTYALEADRVAQTFSAKLRIR